MNKIFGILFFCMVIMLNVAFASYKVDEVVNFSNPCVENNNNCDSSVNCSITITDPLNNVLVNNQKMTYNVANYIYETSFENLGKHTFSMNCTSATESGYERGTFEVNNMGVDDANLLYIIMILLGLFFIFSFIMTIYSYSTNSPLKYMFLIFDFLVPTLITWFIYLFSPVINNHAADLLVVLGTTFGTITFIILMLSLIELTIFILNEAKLKKEKAWQIFN